MEMHGAMLEGSIQDGGSCRICHGESEPDRPLFYPCKCSGSIKYIHQDCLLEWLKVSSVGNFSTIPFKLLSYDLHILRYFTNDYRIILTFYDTLQMIIV